jgi:hypothetical protein
MSFKSREILPPWMSYLRILSHFDRATKIVNAQSRDEHGHDALAAVRWANDALQHTVTHVSRAMIERVWYSDCSRAYGKGEAGDGGPVGLLGVREVMLQML